MRKALIKGGVKQGGDRSTAIGPLPRILPALKETNAKKCVAKLEKAASAPDQSAALD
ncbi:hypothetical protein [Chenggangzhangella methanolivorans]|uniref:Uncharacterized protein n=2 Tax=Chenggangzhangella methanolivorans TaxID=1437009 RepID=A0A9E6UJU0_9HYPH|nr:hypothetical protein [Chenggangzhangella methanolivorans]QZN98486.1 hypothetical protein K6K41_15630 [Chenggangzhangella methanolivorans]